MRAIQNERGGVSQLRSLHARLYSTVIVEVELDLDGKVWSYGLHFNQDKLRRPYIRKEWVKEGTRLVFKRPDDDDKADPSRLSQTHLEQVSANREFRDVASFFAQLRYLHLVPQLVREPDRSVGRSRDPFGGDFLEQLARTPSKTLDARLRKIRDALRVAVPQLKELKLARDPVGVPHLTGLYEHWRPNAGWQDEKQFSDGTLRLLGLLWVLLDGRAPLLLEEPELSLHAAVIRHVPAMMWRLNRKSGRQTIVSTHSADLLSDAGIAPEEVLMLHPGRDGTQVAAASGDREVRSLLAGGASMAEAVLPRTAPKDAAQLSLFAE
jgi:hypothetical protein